MRRLLSIVVVLIILTNSTSVFAIGPELISPPLTPIWNEATVHSSLLDYFDSREAFLNDESTTISSTLSTIVADEASHKQFLESKSIYHLTSSVVIGNVVVYDYFATADVLETVCYLIGGEAITTQIAHTLTLYREEGAGICIIQDKYFDPSCAFYSASFVRNPDTEIQYVPIGGRNCLVNIALDEVGYQEVSGGYTKYGAWYGIPYDHWCVIFVSWCAYQANISEAIIPKKNGTGDFVRHFNIDSDDITPQFGGTAEPQVGDIFMLAGSSAGSVSHVGIVVGVDTNKIYVVHGNWSDAVVYGWFYRTDPSLYAYATPAYGRSHADSTEWSSDLYEHWHVCSICGDTFGHTSHSYVYQSGTGKYRCSTCGYTSSYIPGGM